MPRRSLALAVALLMLLLPPGLAAAETPADRTARREAVEAEVARLGDKAARLRDERAPAERSHEEVPFILADVHLQLARRAVEVNDTAGASSMLREAEALLTALDAAERGPAAPRRAARTHAAPALASAICVHPSGGTPAGEFCQTTIQAAVNLARPGTLIRVLPAIYREAVVVPVRKEGIQIVGDDVETTLLDEQGVPGGTFAITVFSAGVQIRSLTILNSGLPIFTQAPRTVVQGLRIPDSLGTAVASTGPDNGGFQVLSSQIHGDISLFGPDVVVRDNVVTGGQIFVGGPRSLIEGNRIEGRRIVAFDTGEGRPVVRFNRVRGGDAGIQVFARNPVVEANDVASVRLGITVSCFGDGPGDPDACREGSVADNVLSATLDYAFFISPGGLDLPVRNNRVQQSARGLNVNGRGVLVEDNHISESGFAPGGRGYEVFGTAHVLRRNVAFRCRNAGFFVFGDASRLEGNGAVGNFGHGFVVEGADGVTTDVVLERNLASANTGIGIAILHEARHTVVRGNRSTANGLDFCDGGIGTVLSGNMFGTTGPCPP